MSKIVNISKAKKGNKAESFFLGFIFIVAVLCFLLLSPIFQIKKIQVEGVLRLSANSIIDYSNLHYGENIFRINKKEIAENIKKVAYIDEVKIRREWPNGIVIHVKESNPVAEVEFYGSKLMIDEKAKLLEVVTDDIPTNFPQLLGITLNEIVLGEKIHANEEEKLEDFLEVLKSAEENGILKNVTKIVENNGILLYLDEGDIVNLGDVENLPYKMLLLKEIAAKEETASYIDLHDLERKIIKPVWGLFDNSAAGGGTNEE
ncbi:MAG: FtsQ-type POTRA domain-containing protein [Clostridia bacterium]|nr:FtsQ-type POTRA domain-containing protein [Clostridia bacterium]